MDISAALAPFADELVAVRRTLHAHPETGRDEVRTTALLVARLRAAGLDPVPLPGTGLICDIQPSDIQPSDIQPSDVQPSDIQPSDVQPSDVRPGDVQPSDVRPGDVQPSTPTPGPVHTIALRADLDALPLPDETGTPWASTVPGLAHACGHDVHTTVVLGAGLVLARLRNQGLLHCRVRLLFQPAEESTPGGALDVLAAGGLEGVDRILALHCDPHLDTGLVGLRVGAITSAADHVKIVLSGDGGHTSRPHLTGDLVFALGQVITGLPAALSRRLDPRAGVSLVWGRASAGGPYNAIPRTGEVEGTLRMLDAGVWQRAGELLAEVLEHVVGPFGVQAKLLHSRGVPPTVNDADAVALLESAVRTELGPQAAVPTEQSLGGEDFAWYLDTVPGALARLGTRVPGGATYDLHRGDFEPDESAIAVGVRALVAASLLSPLVPARPVADG